MSSRSDVLGELVRQMVSGELPFPYKTTYLDPPETYFTRLQQQVYVDVEDVPFAAPRSVPWGFDGNSISLIVNNKAFDDVDLITDHFTEMARMGARIRGKLSPADAWRNPSIARRVARNALARSHQSSPTTHMLREACYEVIPECTLFKVSLAAGIYKFFLADKIREGCARVLDPFAGWGDRAIGASGAGIAEYIGVDPNAALIEGHQAISKFTAQFGHTSTKFRPVPFEAYGPDEVAEDFPSADGAGPNGADLVFSSPPFHDYELYSSDTTQSVSPGRNESVAEWIRDWFLPITDRAWGALAPGGNLAYYLSGKNGEVTGPLCRHMEAHGREFRGVIACRRGDKRPLPLWVWRKSASDLVLLPPPVNAGHHCSDSKIDDLLEEIYAEMD